MYECMKIKGPLTINGDLNKPEWQKAHKSPRFIDVIGGTPAIYETRAAVLWDDENLYTAFWCDDPFPVATLTQRDAHLWFENDLEVFIDGGETYYEFQINAINTVYEVFYIWQDVYKKGGKYDVPEFDVFDNEARVFGGNHDRSNDHFWRGSHPRGNRWAFLNWDFPGLKSAVKVDGKINDPTVVSKGWTAEIAFPWSGMKWLANDRSLPPKDGDIWKLFLCRYQNYPLNGTVVNAGCGWNIIGTNDNHYPEKFTDIKMVDKYLIL